MKRIVWSTIIGATLSFVQLCRAADPLDSWTQLTFETNNYLTGIASGGGQFVVTGYYTDGTPLVITSMDGTNWTHGVSGTTNILNDVAYGGGRFVAVGDYGTIVVSADGTNWTQSKSGTTNLLNSLISVAYGNGQFLTAGFDGRGLASTDGTSWTSTLLGFSGSPHKVAFGNGQFLLFVGGSIYTSANGSNWIFRFNQGPSGDYSGAAYGNNQIVAVGSAGSSGNTAISPDSIHWTPFSIGQPAATLRAVSFGNGLFVAVGGLNFIDPGVIFSSADGSNWTPHLPGTKGLLADVAFENGRFVAIGGKTTILASPPIVRLDATETLGDGTPQLTLTGPSGQSCTIQVSPDLTNWATLTNFMLTNETVEFSDPAPASPGQHFYRAVVP